MRPCSHATKSGYLAFMPICTEINIKVLTIETLSLLGGVMIELISAASSTGFAGVRRSMLNSV